MLVHTFERDALTRLRLLLPVLLLVVAPLALTACGGGDGEGDEEKIIEVIETSATSDDPADCEALATHAYLEQTQFAEGSEASTKCEEEAAGEKNDIKSVKVSKVEVEDSTATANVAFNGGTFDGQTLSVALIEEDGDWKLDDVIKFAAFDQERLVASAEEAARSSKPGSGEPALEQREVTCFGEAFDVLSKEETERILFGDWSERLVEFSQGCE